MKTCKSCGKKARTISRAIGFCADCIRRYFDRVWPEIKKTHDQSRRAYRLKAESPRGGDGATCRLCLHGCQIFEGDTGYCGLRRVRLGRLEGGLPNQGNLYYYYDALPTNCVGSFVCPAGQVCGYPQYSVSEGPEYGYKNLAVFYHACSFNCLYCQNYHFKEETFSPHRVTAEELARAVDSRTTCICYFGGDPTPQIIHALKVSRLALKFTSGRILRICWESNGAMQEPYLTMMAEMSLHSGGCLKFDLKAWDERIHYSLCGVSNQKTLENFRKLSKYISKRPEPSFLIASTLLVPGYVDELEVAAIAGFLAGLNPRIPYSLLAFYPNFYMRDLPTTSRTHALRCKEVAEQAGLHHVHIGNLHLLGEDY